MLPTRGVCHGVFLLTHSARSGRRQTVEEWIEHARALPTVMAAALDLATIGNHLIRCDLATFNSGVVKLNPQLLCIGDAADDDVLKKIATLLLEYTKPPWLRGSILEGVFHPESIPTSAMQALEWLGSDFEILITNASLADKDNDIFLSWLGSIGESAVLSVELDKGYRVRHVSQISDNFGYDVESYNSRRNRLEVKTSIVGKENRIYLTRNEADKALKFPDEWQLINVILFPGALTAPVVTRDLIQQIRIASSLAVTGVLPTNSAYCRWLQTVEIKTIGLQWMEYISADAIPITWRIVRPSNI